MDGMQALDLSGQANAALQAGAVQAAANRFNGVSASVGQLKKPIDMAAIDKSAEQFEAVFLGQMLQPMFEGIKTDSTFGGGHGEDMFRSMMVTEIGNQMAKSGGIGLAASVKEELLRMQENQMPAKSKSAARSSTPSSQGDDAS